MRKSWRTRLDDTYAYLDSLVQKGTVPRTSVEQIKERVKSGDGGFSDQEVSKALHLGWDGLFTKYAKGQSSDQRQALRALKLVMLIHQSHAIPHYNLQTIKTVGETPPWKSAPQSQIDIEIGRLLSSGAPSPSTHTSGGKVSNPALYGVTHGISLSSITQAKGGLAPPRPSTAKPIPIVAQPKEGSFEDKIGAFEEMSRSRKVLSGHGSWIWDDTVNGYPWTQLKKGQRIFFYVPHYVPLLNSVGQKVDNHQAVECHSVYTRETAFRIPDYTLHDKDTLTLMGHSKHDSRFVTTQTDKRLSAYIAQFPENTDFHWAACRVVVGWYWSGTANDWIWAMWDTDHWEYKIGGIDYTSKATPPPRFGPLPK